MYNNIQTLIIKSVGVGMFFFFLSKDAINWSKLTVKMFLMSQFQINVILSNYSFDIQQNILEKMYHPFHKKYSEKCF